MATLNPSSFKHYHIILTCLLNPADKLATVSLLLTLTSLFFGRIIPFENSVNKNGQLKTAHKLRHTLFIIHILDLKYSLRYKSGTIRCLYPMLKKINYMVMRRILTPSCPL
jgi:hypothetical protein